MRDFYHYTSIETLALILENRSICFNNLLNVDDIEEAETRDMGNFGRYVYVSCWTECEKESISLWNLYTPNMEGVRIKLKEFPFKKYSFKKGEYYLKEDIDTYINIEKYYNENRGSIVANQPTLKKIEYTDIEGKIYPEVRNESHVGAVKEFLDCNELKDLQKYNIKVSYSFEEIGIYKRLEWAFQQEWRYLIIASPMGVKDLEAHTFEKQKEFIRRIESKETLPAYSRLFLELDGGVLEDIEIVLGPKMNMAQRIMVRALVEKYCPNAQVRNSQLRVR